MFFRNRLCSQIERWWFFEGPSSAQAHQGILNRAFAIHSFTEKSSTANRSPWDTLRPTPEPSWGYPSSVRGLAAPKDPPSSSGLQTIQSRFLRRSLSADLWLSLKFESWNIWGRVKKNLPKYKNAVCSKHQKYNYFIEKRWNCSIPKCVWSKLFCFTSACKQTKSAWWALQW